jgi:tetratricopeptide (TPR) repeat protein
MLYNTLALVYAEPDSQEQKEIILLQKAALEKVIALSPKDARARVEYARVIGDEKLQISALREIVASEPADEGARFSLGVLLVDTGKADEGIEVLKEVVDLAGYEHARIYERRLRQILVERGRRAEAAEISKQVANKKPRSNGKKPQS